MKPAPKRTARPAGAARAGAPLPDPIKRHHEDSDALCRYMRERTGPTVFLAFSRGKDAVGAWLQLRRYFENIIPVHQDSVPGGMPIENEMIPYYEGFFDTKIERFTHWGHWKWLTYGVFATPEMTARLDPVRDAIWLACRANMYGRVYTGLRKKHGCPDAWVATGVRASDSQRRALSIRVNGPVTPRLKDGDSTFLPVFDWSVERLDDEITEAGVKLPRDYDLFGCTFDGIDVKWSIPIRKHCPEDWAELLKWHPLLPAVLVRLENNQSFHAAGPR